jgi:NTP pyrophosphatase (non-canonical NTP hydrolase)
MDKTRLYNIYIDKYGDTQKVVAIEELSELIKELSKDLRGNKNVENIAQEIADVTIMIEQLTLIYDIAAEIEDWKQIKLARMEDRL